MRLTSRRRATVGPEGDAGPRAPGFVVYGITIGQSARTLLRGQLGWLRAQGWRVDLVTSPGDDARVAVSREGVVLHELPMSRGVAPMSDLRGLVSWWRLLRRLRPDAVNVSTPKAGLLGGLAAWAARVPRRLYVVRGLRVEGARGPGSAILWLAERVSMMAATDVVFVSRSLAREADRRRLLPGRKSWLIGSGSSNGVDAVAIARRVVQVDRDELRERLGFGASNVVVGYVGRVTRDKGIETLLRVMRSADLDPAVRLLIVGPVEDDRLRSEAIALGPRATTVGWIDDVWGHLPALDVLVLPTRREGFPNVVLEAAAAGIPAITTRATGAVDSVVDEATGLLVDVDDPGALKAAINRLAAEPRTLRRMGQAARMRVDAEFRPEVVWRGIAEILAGHPDPCAAVRMASTDAT